MVAHNIDVPFVSAVMVRRRTFFQGDPSIVFLTVRLFIAPPDKVEVEPCFVVAALIGRTDTKSFMGYGECAVKSPLAWNRSRSLQWYGAGRHRQSLVSRGFSNGTDVVSVVAPATRSTFSSSITARIVRKSFFPTSRFLCNDIIVNVFWPLGGCRRKEARDSTPCKTQPISPAITLSGNTRLVSSR